MQRFMLNIVLLVMTISYLAAKQADSVPDNLPQGRAMWVWNSDNIITDIVNNVGDLRRELYTFCQSPHGNPDHQISVLFWGCKDALYNYPDSLRSFLREASAKGLTVEYLDGDPTWATYNQDTGIERISKVIEFNASATCEEEKLRGIQFDVEPYLLKSSSSYSPPYWDTDLDSVWAQYFNYIDSCQTLIDNADQGLYFGIAIPRWYENYVGVAELGRLQALTDYIAIMDYNENASVIIHDAANEIDNAEIYDKKVWIGVETKNILPETVSFYEEGVAVMETALAEVMEAYQDSASFLGIAIHAYAYYRDLNSSNDVEPEIRTGSEINLFQNFENPVRRGTTIEYQLPAPMTVEVTIYNMLGQKVETLIAEKQPAGLNQVFWNAANFASGIYYYQIRTPESVQVKRMVVVR